MEAPPAKKPNQPVPDYVWRSNVYSVEERTLKAVKLIAWLCLLGFISALVCTTTTILILF